LGKFFNISTNNIIIISVEPTKVLGIHPHTNEEKHFELLVAKNNCPILPETQNKKIKTPFYGPYPPLKNYK
jgi:hypothetical protein